MSTSRSSEPKSVRSAPVWEYHQPAAPTMLRPMQASRPRTSTQPTTLRAPPFFFSGSGGAGGGGGLCGVQAMGWPWGGGVVGAATATGVGGGGGLGGGGLGGGGLGGGGAGWATGGGGGGAAGGGGAWGGGREGASQADAGASHWGGSGRGPLSQVSAWGGGLTGACGAKPTGSGSESSSSSSSTRASRRSRVHISVVSPRDEGAWRMLELSWEMGSRVGPSSSSGAWCSGRSGCGEPPALTMARRAQEERPWPRHCSATKASTLAASSGSGRSTCSKAMTAQRKRRTSSIQRLPSASLKSMSSTRSTTASSC